jgi:formate hydrogenlyase subunit 3/multisubunit Na+/H+ antiporter MnhD subunit
MSQWSSSLLTYGMWVPAVVVLFVGLRRPRIAGWLALGCGVATTAVVMALVGYVSRSKETGPPDCVPYRSAAWYHAADLAAVGIALAAVSISAALAAGIRRERVLQEVAVGMVATAGGVYSFFTIVFLAVCGS